MNLFLSIVISWIAKLVIIIRKQDHAIHSNIAFFFDPPEIRKSLEILRKYDGKSFSSVGVTGSGTWDDPLGTCLTFLISQVSDFFLYFLLFR